MTIIEEMVDSGVFLEQEKKKAYLKFLRRKKSHFFSSQFVLEPGLTFSGEQETDSLVLKAGNHSEQFCELWLLRDVVPAKCFKYHLCLEHR